MVKITVGIEGMACGMCETHVNDAIRRAFTIKKVLSSHRRQQTEIIADAPLEESKVREVIEDTGYRIISFHTQPYQKKGLFGK